MSNPLHYFLSAHSYCCEFEDGAIILELSAGSYVGIDAEYLPDLRLAIKNWPLNRRVDATSARTPSAAACLLIDDLVGRGILTKTPTPKRTHCLTAPSAAAENTLIANHSPRMPMREVVPFIIAWASVIIWNKDETLRSLLNWLNSRQSLLNRYGRLCSPAKVATSLYWFLHLRVWFYTADRHCLFDSLVLAVFLTKRRIQCTFVIGVSTKPFLAHSWVQIGSLVLNDTPEHVNTFMPILTIGESA